MIICLKITFISMTIIWYLLSLGYVYTRYAMPPRKFTPHEVAGTILLSLIFIPLMIAIILY